MSVIEVQPPMNPRKAECSGFYLYGSGYYAREDSQTAILRAQHASSFCNEECPVMKLCFERHVKRVRELEPEAAEEYARLLEQSRRRGVPEALVQATLVRRRQPDPFMAHALVNFKRGKRDREQKR